MYMKKFSILIFLLLNINQSAKPLEDKCKEEVDCNVAKQLLIAIPHPGETVIQAKILQAIVFNYKIVISKIPPETFMNNNIYEHVVNQFQIHELILDCANGFFACTPLEYVKLHTGNLNMSDEEIKPIAKDYFEGNIGAGIWDQIGTMDCIMANQVDHDMAVPGFKKVLVMCQPAEDEQQGNLELVIKPLPSVIFKYNVMYKDVKQGGMNNLPLRITRCKGQDTSDNISIGHLVVQRNRVVMQSNLDEYFTKNQVFEAQWTQLAPMGKSSEAFKLSKKDGYCVEIMREFVEPQTICFDSEKIRDLFARTMQINYLHQKIFDNVQFLEDTDTDACDSSKLHAVFRTAWDIEGFSKKMSPVMATQIVNSRQELLVLVWETFLKFSGDQPDTKLTKNIQTAQETCMTTDFADPNFWKEPYE